VNLNHFRLLRVVGKGAFGKVRIVERKDTGLTFALKYIRKDEGSFRRGRRGWRLQTLVAARLFSFHADAVSQLYAPRVCGTSSASAACSSTSTIPFSAT
jgi:serine/threonine protein kinase